MCTLPEDNAVKWPTKRQETRFTAIIIPILIQFNPRHNLCPKKGFYINQESAREPECLIAESDDWGVGKCSVRRLGNYVAIEPRDSAADLSRSPVSSRENVWKISSRPEIMVRASEVGKEWDATKVAPPLYISRVRWMSYVASRLDRCAVVDSGNCGLLH